MHQGEGGRREAEGMFQGASGKGNRMRLDEICRDLLILLMKGLLYHSAACIFYNVVSVKTMREDLLLLFLYLPLLLFAVIRRKCGNFFLFLLFHILISGIFVLVFTGLEQRIVIGGCICVMAVLSLHTGITAENGQETRPPLSSLALFVGISLASWQSARVQVMRICGYEAFLFLILFVVHRNLANFSKFLNENETMDGFPKEQMRAMNNLLLGIFVLFFMAGMLFFKEPSEYLFLTIGVVCRGLLRMIVKILSWIFRNDVQQPESFAQQAVQEAAMPEMEAGGTSALALLLEKLLIAGASIVLAAAAVYLLARFFYGMYQRFYEQHKEPDDESEFIWKMADMEEKLSKKHKKDKKPSVFSFGSPKQKIRRLYKKSILERFRSKENIPAEMTPMELESAEDVYFGEDKLNDELRKEGKETEMMEGNGVSENLMVRQKVFLYEKARYSQHACDKKDVEQMKQYCKNQARNDGV